MNWESRVGSRAFLVATQVRAVLAGRGMSQWELSASTGVPLGRLRREVAGIVPFDVEDLVAVAAALQTPLTSLVDRTREPMDRPT